MKRVLLVDHAVSKRDDRASSYLAESGHEIVWRSPGQGDALPPLADFDAVVLYGGAEMLSTDIDKPETSYLRREVDYVERWLAAGKPYLGICLGSQIMAKALGAEVRPREDRLYELGFVRIEPTAQGNGFLPEALHVYHWHQEGFELPAGVEHLATGPVFPHQAMRYGDRAYGIQFHPEVWPRTFQRWLDEVPDATTRPGAQPREKQVADAALYDTAMYAWFRGFLDRWIGE